LPSIPADAVDFKNESGLVYDEADLLTEQEEKELESKIGAVAERYSCDVVIAAVDSLDGKTAQAYADDFFDYNGYGIGPERDGILFLISMEDRDWAISTCGFGISAFTDWGQEKIIDALIADLSAGDYPAAFGIFAEECDKYLDQARNGEPFDVDNQPEDEPASPIQKLLFSMLFAALIASFVIGVMKKSHITIRKHALAHDYVRPGSFRVTDGNEMFLYKNISKKRIVHESGSGGSSTHRSSSGSTHGGSSGKF
jgi:uncharacterized protein